MCALRGAEFVYCPGVAAGHRVHVTDSLTTRDPAAFTRGCLRNAVSVEEWWTHGGGVTGAREAALLRVYGQVARASFGRDDATFEVAYAALERLAPGYVPAQPRHLALAARLVGYRSAEALAVRYRGLKRALHAIVPLA